MLASLALLLAGCAADPSSSGAIPASRDMLAAIQRYYESNAAEENNACSAVIMSGVTRSEVVPDKAGRLVVDVTYTYGNFTSRSSNRCRGFGNRRFTLTEESGRFRVVGMTGERRLGPSWRIW